MGAPAPYRDTWGAGRDTLRDIRDTWGAGRDTLRDIRDTWGAGRCRQGHFEGHQGHLGCRQVQAGCRQVVAVVVVVVVTDRQTVQIWCIQLYYEDMDILHQRTH